MTDDFVLTPEQEAHLALHLPGAQSVAEVLAGAGHSWLIEGWLASSVTVVDGKPEAGKSTLVAAMAAAVATKTEWHGEPVLTEREGPVLVIVTDAGDVAQWALKVQEHGVPEDSWQLIPFNPSKWDDYEYAAAVTEARLVVFDNVTGALDGPINDADPSQIIAPLNRISNMGVPVVAIAHSSRSGSKGPMGPTAYTAWRRHGLSITAAGKGRKVSRTGNLGSFPDVELGGGPTEKADSPKPSKVRDRAEDTAKRRDEMADYVVAKCQGMGVNQAAKSLAAKFELSPKTAKKYLSAGGALSGNLERSGEGSETRWARRDQSQ